MNRQSLCSGCQDPSDFSRCSCTDCNTSFCIVKRNKTDSCNKCREYETSVFYYGEEARLNTTSMTREINTETPDRISKLDNVDKDRTDSKICSKFNKHVTLANVSVDVNVAENEKDEDTNNSQKDVSNTKAHLSAQIMNVSYKDYKQSVSVEKSRPPQKVLSNANDILKKIKEAYDACTCKICECLIGKSLPSPDKPCDCEPCNCNECTRYRKGLTNSAVDPRVIPLMRLDKAETEVRQSKKCECTPCECVQCSQSNPEPCSCKPCQCIECKSMVVHRTKTIIVAPMEEGPQRANCLCSPCDCARCSHRGLNLSPNRVHEMSTGINRHPNCHCETCMNDACEPNGTDSCRCETRRGIMSKPFDQNPHDFNIHRATVTINPLKKSSRKPKTGKSIPIYAVEDTTRFPLKNSQSKNLNCMCSACECVMCECKDDVKNVTISKVCDTQSLKTVKIPSVEAKLCQCSPCECQLCSKRQQMRFCESKNKSCKCQVCDCLYCAGALQPKDDNSTIIPVLDKCRSKKCDCGPFCKCNSLQRTLKRKHGEISCINDDKLFDGDLYPIKRREFQNSSFLRNDLLSEPELLSKSSEYTQLKHSKGQSNVFKNEASEQTISKQNLTIYHMIPERKFDPPLYNSEIPLTCSKNNDEIRSESFDKSKEEKDLTEFYYASTSKSSSSGAKLEILDHHYKPKNVLESVITACLKDAIDPSICYKSQTPSLLSISLSTHNLLNLSNSSLLYSRKSHQLTISSPNRKVDRSSGPLLNTNNRNYIMNLLETHEYDSIRSTPKYKVKQCECNICQCCGTCDDQNDRIKLNANEVTQTQYDANYIQNDDCFLCNRFETYFKSNLSDYDKSDTAVEKNRRKTSLNRNTDDTRNKYCAWKLENGNPRAFSANTINLLPRKNAPYERALVTLQKAKEFSLQLGQLLEKYERANLEFESISKKLKQSHETIFNSFKYDSCKESSRSDNYISQAHEIKNKTNGFSPLSKKSHKNYNSMPLIVEDAKKPVHITESISKKENDAEKVAFINDVTADRSIGTITTNSLKSICLNYNDKLQSNDKLLEKSYDNITLINGPKIPPADLSYEKNGEVMIDKSLEEIKLTEKYYNIYRKLMQRTAHIKRMNGIDVCPAENQTFDCNTLKKMIKQEMKTLVKELCELEKKTKSGNSFGDEGRLSNILAVVEELKAEDVMTVVTVADVSTENKSTENVIQPSRIEVVDTVKFTATLNTETPAKEPLLSLTDSLPAAPAIHDLNKESTARVMKSKTYQDHLKVGFLSVRRVSDHTVTVKWEKPKASNDVMGYEILVDGLPVQKILNPARCMAVITCLPHTEKVLLSIRTIAKTLKKSGAHPCSTIAYRPRLKYINV